MEQKNIRNFCIIAHIDHGKSTLADRFLEYTDTIPEREMKNQVLDNMDLERERGITIKSHAIQINYRSEDNQEYLLNLIDTPGHVDFTYEVSRSLAACEGALLLIDASQGIEAQTLSNLYLALEQDLVIIPVINKIDIPNVEIDRVKSQITELMGIDETEILLASAKKGIGVVEILEAIVRKIPPPQGNPELPLKALIFDSTFDAYRGVIAYVRIVDGILKEKDKISFFSNKNTYMVDEVGILQMKRKKVQELESGRVGYIIPGAKSLEDINVGDTIYRTEEPIKEPLIGYKEVKPMVFAGFYPIDNDDYENLKSSLAKLKLNDASLFYEAESSDALGFGYRCGFLGLLHKEVIQQRLEREYNLDLVTTIPNVRYDVYKKNGETVSVDNPSDLPDVGSILKIEEPFVKAQIITPPEFIGNIMKLSKDKRGILGETEYLDKKSVLLHFDFPFSEIIIDYFDKLKSATRGYASFDYEYDVYRESDLLKVDILLNGNSVDALSMIVHKDKAYMLGRSVCGKLKKIIPRQQFEVAVQAAVGNKIIARETIKAFRKNVTEKLYGGDVTRKRKLLEKQKAGKKRMKRLGKVEIPQEAFLSLYEG
ncbi:translation elongation factor 4 [bacterium]|nr:translation elongation factor 4 [bacterium]